MEFSRFTIPLEAIADAVTRQHGIRLFVLRTDLNHPYISGNKLFKLKYNLLEARNKGYTTLLSFGGAFSNHIAALAAAGKEYGFATTGIIRGEEHQELNPTLQLAQLQGMRLHYVSRTLYRDKEALYNYVNATFGEDNFYLIPEGGSNELGVLGCREILSYVNEHFDCVCCACGTGATFAGIVQALEEKQRAIGFLVLKSSDSSTSLTTGFGVRSSESVVLDWSGGYETSQWNINKDYHFGGYAKITDELKNFIKEFEAQHSIPLDYVYTGKMMYGIYDLMKKGYFERGATIVAVHTGGLQGNKGFEGYNNTKVKPI